MWWQDSEPSSRIVVASAKTSANSKHSESLDALAKLVESVQPTENNSNTSKRKRSIEAPVSACVEIELKAKIAELERQDREGKDHHAEQLTKFLRVETETKDQLARALIKVARLELQQKTDATHRVNSINATRIAKKELAALKQTSVDEIKCLQASIAFKERKFLGIERHYDEQFSRCRDAHYETERQNKQLVELQAKASAKFANSISAHERSASKRDSTIRQLEASHAEQAAKIAELEQYGRESELKFAQLQSSLLESEKQKSQLVESHAAAATELTTLVAAHERSTTECASTIVLLEASQAKQTAKIAELEQYGRESELKYAQAQSSLLDSEERKSQLVELHAATAKEFKESAASHERSTAECASTIVRLEASQAEQAAKIAELEQYGRDAELKFAQAQNSLLESEEQKSQLVVLQAATAAEFKESAAAHERSTAECASTIVRLEASQAKQAAKIAELEQFGRDTELKFAQAQSSLLDSEKQKSQLVVWHAATTTELKESAAAHERSASERDFTIIRLVASLAEQANKIAELEQYGREAETRYAQSQSSLLESEEQKSQLVELHAATTTELKESAAAHERSTAECASTIAGLEASQAEQAAKIAELEQYGREAELKFAQAQNSLLESEEQKAQLVELHTATATELQESAAAHERSTAENASTIVRLEANLAEQANKMVELKQYGRDAELKFAKAQNSLLESEEQKSQLVALHTATATELQELAAEYERSTAENASTIVRLEANLAEQANKMVELEQYGRDAELKFAKAQNSLLESEEQKSQLVALQAAAAKELKEFAAAHVRSASERDLTIIRLEASLAEQANKIAELEQYGRDAELKFAQAQSSLLDSEEQKSQLVVLHAATTTELQELAAAHERSASKRDSTIIRLEARLAEQANKMVELEQYGLEAELRFSQSQSCLLNSEEQKSQLVALQAAAAKELKAVVESYERSTAKRDLTIIRLDGNLTEHAAKIAELEQYGREAEFRYAQSQSSLLDSEQQKSQLVELQAEAATELGIMKASHELSLAERDATISRLKYLQNALDDSIRCLRVSKLNSKLAESRLQQCEQTISQLGEQSIQLQNRLELEAASRRKTEAALKQATESANDDSALHALGEQFANVQRIERLTNELMATRRFCVYLQQQANAKAKQGQRGVQLLAPMPTDMPRAAS